MTAKISDCDILIVGAGLVGLSLAVALHQTSLRLGLIDARSVQVQADQDDGRASAIALGSVQILDQIGAWKRMQQLGVSPIHQIQISDEGFTPVVTLKREELGLEALGYVVENWVTLQALNQVLEQQETLNILRPATVERIEVQADRATVSLSQDGQTRSLAAQLLIGADGRQSWMRQQAQLPVTGWAYDQVLIVSTIATEFPHGQTAYERFHHTGPFAVLPMTADPQAPHRCCIVWTAIAREEASLLALSDAEFIAALQPRLPRELGAVLSVSPRYCYHPRRQNADRYFGDRLALIGDAAHTTHPVGGQGFNMGARDVAALASLLVQAHLRGRDLGSPELLRAYDAARRGDNETVLLGTDLANRLFSNDWLPLQGLRRLALLSLDRLTPLKQLLIQYAMGITEQQQRSVSLKV